MRDLRVSIMSLLILVFTRFPCQFGMAHPSPHIHNSDFSHSFVSYLKERSSSSQIMSEVQGPCRENNLIESSFYAWNLGPYYPLQDRSFSVLCHHFSVQHKKLISNIVLKNHVFLKAQGFHKFSGSCISLLNKTSSLLLYILKRNTNSTFLLHLSIIPK